MRITGAQVFDLQEGFVQRDICFDGRLLSGSSADGKTYDASGRYVIPGLTDVHFHGRMGRDFSDAEPEGLEIMAQYELSGGHPDLPCRYDPDGGATHQDLSGGRRPSGRR
ncbi:MAG: hypothetical protein ACLRNQ_29570 [Flavonifractor plautii]